MILKIISWTEHFAKMANEIVLIIMAHQTIDYVWEK